MIFIISFIQTVLVGLIDALIKGNVIVHYEAWKSVPWYFKDENFVYPGTIALLFVVMGIFIARKFKFGIIKYLVFSGIWGLSAMESLSYWFWIMTLRIGQKMPGLPDSSFFGW